MTPPISNNSIPGLSRGQLALGLFGLVAPVLTFLLAISPVPDSLKIFVLLVMAGAYSLVCFRALKSSRATSSSAPPSGSVDEDPLGAALQSIGGASEFFGSSLKPEDLFRLVSDRVAQVFPFASSALFVQNERGDALNVVQSGGLNRDELINIELPLDRGIAGMAWLSREVEIDPELELELASIDSHILAGLRSAVAIPLLHEQQPFAVLVLYKDRAMSLDEALRPTFEAIGERVTPLLLSSISFEQSIANALTDPITNLPNERAFFMVLENQLAESQRFRSERPLTVMTVDIKNFAEANQHFGFATGDRILAFAADHLQSQLRKMDFLSRSSSDEFLIILPTAPENFADEIVERIRARFAAEVFAVSETEEIKLWLNFGWATFWQDGETAAQLLQHARIRKQQAKAEEPSKVLWFPKEYVN
jgi:diguanylate cyclase (GGDEF)-like protein